MYIECKDFIDKLTEFRKNKDRDQILETSEGSEKLEIHEDLVEDKQADFFLTQKGETSSVSELHEESEEEGLSYEKRIGFDKKKLLELFQEIEANNLFLINNVQDEEQILEYIRKHKQVNIDKKEKEIASKILQLSGRITKQILLLFISLVNDFFADQLSVFRRQEKHFDHECHYQKVKTKVRLPKSGFTYRILQPRKHSAKDKS